MIALSGVIFLKRYKFNKSCLSAYAARFVLGLGFFMLHLFAYAEPISAQSMLINLDRSLPAVMSMIVAICVVVGLALMFSAIYKLKVYGELRTMTASNTNLKEPLTMLLAASFFLFLPTALHDTLFTLYATPNFTPLSYITSEVPQFQLGLKAILDVVRIIGLVSFIRGWLYLVQATQQGRGGFGKGMTHIIAGILALNIAATKAVIWHTFGFG